MHDILEANPSEDENRKELGTSQNLVCKGTLHVVSTRGG